MNSSKTLGASIAVWRKPNTSRFYVLLSNNEPLTGDLSDFTQPGFIFNEFEQVTGQCHLLQADLVYLLDEELVTCSHGAESLWRTTVEQKIRGCLAENEKNAWYANSAGAGSNDESREHFISCVERSLASIEKDVLEKVVLATTKTVPLPEHFDLSKLLTCLAVEYPEHFVCFLTTPTYGSWVGCSPELLLSHESGEVQTVALAGTKKSSEVWREKEIHEQKVVNHYIRKALSEVDDCVIVETDVSNMTVGRYQHLKTRFQMNVESLPVARQQEVVRLLVADISPTPAVCGMPKAQAKSYINRYEGFSRGLYSGFWGPSLIESGQTQFFVNIRCMQLLKNNAVLYVGAGITNASSPTEEWNEINLKSQTLLEFL
ncbi:MAG: hypothetical protein GY787_33285 [Alteromonadales bacterium]|nr:hypothetical protein [Alteromonadales bacterium]